MSKRGFSLMEMMIVIAVLSISLYYLFLPVQVFFTDQRFCEESLEHEERIFDLFSHFKNVFDESSVIESVSANEIRLSGKEPVRISRLDSGNTIRLQKGAKNFTLNLKKSANVGEFALRGSRTVVCQIRMPGTSMQMFWRVAGK
jgi:prepilin-type N-terminal cleavage/methylation domain-containing protein